MKIKICLWLNMPSIHQTPLIDELLAQNVDLLVRYFAGEELIRERASQGWQIPELKPCEQFVGGAPALSLVADWHQRVHIVPGISDLFCRRLIEELIAANADWLYWGERIGISFAEKVNFNPILVKYALPFLIRFTHAKYATLINKSALGALSIGNLAEKNLITIGVDPKKIRHLYYSTRELPVNTVPDSPRKSFVYVGSIYYLKGIDLLLKAFAKLTHNDWTLNIVGKDLGRGQYQKMARQLGISDQVSWTGPVSSASVHEYLQQGDVLILPSRFDGWGAVLNEGANAGKALISTQNCGAAWHLIEDGKNGFRIASGRVAPLQKAMQYYVDRPEQALTHGAHSRALYYQKFTPQKNAERLLDAIADLKLKADKR